MKNSNDHNPQVLNLPDYSGFFGYLGHAYKPYVSEFYEGEDKAIFKYHYSSLTHAKRFYSILKYFNLYFPDQGSKVVDIGGYPGTMLKLLGKYSNRQLTLYQCGLFSDPSFLSEMELYGIATLAPVDIDPPPYYQKELEEKHNFTVKLADDAVDFVIATEIIEHLVYPLHFLAEARRILKPGGRILITTPNVAKSSAWIRTLLGKSNLDPLKQTQVYMHGNWRGHVRLYSREELVSLLLGNKFRILEAKAVNNGEHWKTNVSLLRKIDFAIRSVIEFVLPWTKPGLLIVAEKTL
ncbi:MAG TPA: hypothetical protein DCL44_11085 [Elusimicrobia bacterium]|nr:hypothetical protein [Elusimicrobiota bacterium]